MRKLRLRTLILVGVAAALASDLAAQEEAPARLPEVVTTAPGLAEDRPVGVTGRPEWTSARRFATTRVYLQVAPGEFAFEQWLRFRDKKDGTNEWLFQTEVEVGLPYRFQLDIYANYVADEHRDFDYDNTAFELRWALADWGKIPLNPTLYAEYKVGNQAPNVAEFKLLLGESFAPRVHWGLNLVFERELGGSLTNEFQVSQGIGYTILDERLSAGLEMKYIYENESGSRGDAERKFLVGPSVQVRPTRNMHLDLIGLVGTTHDSPNVECYVIFGFDFGRGGESHYAPSSTRSN